MDDQYKIIGGDGREYGPASLEELKSWVREGRVSATTLVWCSSTLKWLPAAEFVELYSELGLHKPAGPSATSTAPANTVGFLPRVAAYLVDQVVLGVIGYIIWITFLAQLPGWEMPDPAKFSTGSTADAIAALKVLMEFGNKLLVIFIPTIFLYEVLLNGRFGATLGKRLIGARIVHVDGAPIGYRVAALRWLGERLSDMFLCYVGHFFVLFRSDKRALHDLIAGTCVIFKR